MKFVEGKKNYCSSACALIMMSKPGFFSLYFTLGVDEILGTNILFSWQ